LLLEVEKKKNDYYSSNYSKRSYEMFSSEFSIFELTIASREIGSIYHKAYLYGLL